MSNIILAIDPGPVESAVLAWDADSAQIVSMQLTESVDGLMFMVSQFATDSGGKGPLAIENIRGYGLSVGNEVFDTCIVVGRAVECWRWAGGRTEPLLVERRAVKAHLCNTTTAKDKDVRAALIDRFGERGVAKQKGRLAGVSTHLWAALAVAVYVADTSAAREKGWSAGAGA